jgi:hypothetical protein
MSRRFLAAATAMLALTGSAGAQDYGQIAYFGAAIGPEDFHNSAGARLTDPGAVLQQDRANFHRFGIRHPGDESDPVFADRAQRSRLPELYLAGGREPWFEEAVARGAPFTLSLFVCGYGGVPDRVYLAPPGSDHSGCF